jgi:hypothetical protein
VAHGPLLGLAAMAYANLRRVFEAWVRSGFAPITVQEWTDHEGKARTRTIENPLVRQLRLQQALCAQLLGEFGLTPASASKVQTQGGEQNPGFDAFLQGPNVVAFSRRKKA